MAKQVTVAAENRYCQARLRAAEYNPDFANRTTASVHLPGVTEDSLKKYELDITRPPNTVVALMADAYNEPELRSWYCANECPLGRNCREIDIISMDRAIVRMKKALKDMYASTDQYYEIIDDGVIDAEEAERIPELREQFLEARSRIDEILAALEKAEKLGQYI